MGNSTSKPGGGSASSASAASSSVVCYYELLGIELTATPEEIKKAYRSKALQLHPDKNMHRVQEATEMFAKIQNAYQVLYDPQERAFYDRHRESILRKGKGSKAAASGYSVDDLMNFFDPSVFKGYGDDPRGFYAVYRDLFAFLEDLETEEADDPKKYEFTSFGSKNSPFEPSLKIFYDKFTHFSSCRSFYEADTYDDGYAENRRHRRAIGKENQRLRDTMRREYNDTVRNLAAWVRKRDPRWQAYQKERTLQKKVAEERRKDEVIRKRAEMAERYVEPDWAAINDQSIDDEIFLLRQLERLQFSDNENDTAYMDNDYDDDEDEDEDFYCIVCKKVFKNHMQWKNHERSKKHINNMIKAGFDPENEEEEEEVDESSTNGSIYEDCESNTSGESASEALENESDDDSETIETQSSSIDQIKKESSTEIGQQKPPKKKIRQKNAAPAAAPAPSKSKKKPTNINGSSAASSLKCTVCHEAFDSRNKLFKHIEMTGHAALKGGKKKK